MYQGSNDEVIVGTKVSTKRKYVVFGTFIFFATLAIIGLYILVSSGNHCLRFETFINIRLNLKENLMQIKSPLN